MTSVVSRDDAAAASGGPGRERVARAGLELFGSNGYHGTTVDAIAERAGVGRRTFFRYFRTKEDVIFSTHEQVIEAVTAHLAAVQDLSPLRAVCSGTRMVFRSYVEQPQVSVQRYQLIRSEPALRDRELAWVSKYVRLFAGYLHNRLDPSAENHRLAEVAASAIVAAHNHELRSWLQSGAEGDPFPALETAFDWVVSRFESSEAAMQGAVVAVVRPGQSLEDVVERISRSL